jgi:ketosteroid isomerase-like protein
MIENVKCVAKRAWFIMLGLVLVFSTMMAARDSGNQAGSDQTKLIALENAWNQAQLHHDAKALNDLVSEAFVYTDYDGTVMDKARFMADFRDVAYQPTLVANEDVKVIPYRSIAIVIGTYHTKGTYKRQPFEHWGRFTDTWVYQDSRWQCIASHTNLIKK